MRSRVGENDAIGSFPLLDPEGGGVRLEGLRSEIDVIDSCTGCPAAGNRARRRHAGGNPSGPMISLGRSSLERGGG